VERLPRGRCGRWWCCGDGGGGGGEIVCVDAEVDATSVRIESEEEAWFVDRLVVVAGQEECR